MGNTNANTKNPSKLRDEYGPAPWWSEDHLAELIHVHGLSCREIADIWEDRVHWRTVNEYRRQYGIDRRDGR